MYSVRTVMMLCRIALFAAALLAPLLPASAASLNARLNDARALLESGAATEAIEAYREILIDAPESAPALFGVACGVYRQAEAAAESGDPEAAADKYEEAREAFETIGFPRDPDLRANAAFNAANATAAAAKLKLATAEEDPNTKAEAVTALEKAVGAYETVLEDFPDHPRAQQNLDHVRYLLMKLLQQKEDEQEEPPPAFSSFVGIPTTELDGMDAEIEDPGKPEEGGNGPKQQSPPTVALVPEDKGEEV